MSNGIFSQPVWTENKQPKTEPRSTEKDHKQFGLFSNKLIMFGFLFFHFILRFSIVLLLPVVVWRQYKLLISKTIRQTRSNNTHYSTGVFDEIQYKLMYLIRNVNKPLRVCIGFVWRVILLFLCTDIEKKKKNNITQHDKTLTSIIVLQYLINLMGSIKTKYCITIARGKNSDRSKQLWKKKKINT